MSPVEAKVFRRDTLVSPNHEDKVTGEDEKKELTLRAGEKDRIELGDGVVVVKCTKDDESAKVRLAITLNKGESVEITRRTPIPEPDLVSATYLDDVVTIKNTRWGV